MHTEILSYNLHRIKKAFLELNDTCVCEHCGCDMLTKILIPSSIDSVVVYNVPVLICDSCSMIIEPKNIYPEIQALLKAEGVERGEYCIPLEFEDYEKGWKP